MSNSGDVPLNQALQAGTAALQRGDWAAAQSHGRTAVALAPAHPGGHSVLGLALLQLGEVGPAIAELEQAAQRDRNNPGLLGNLAQAYAAAARHDDAHSAFRRAQRLSPAHWPYAQGAAIALAQLGKTEEAEALLRRLTARYPDQAMLWSNLGKVQLGHGQAAAAEASYREALRLDPENLNLRLTLGAALHQQSRFSDAELTYRQCISAEPQWLPPRLNLISVLIDDGRCAAAEQECAALIAIAPRLPEAHRFLAAARGHQGKQLQALAAHRAAAEYAPDDAVSQRSYGGALAECGQLHAASRVLARAATLDDDAIACAQLQSMVDLAHGRFNDGWSAYRSRPAYQVLSKKWAAAAVTQELPQDLAGKPVRVHREQGLGDELFFLRQLPLLRARGARITVCASAKIAVMVQRAGVADAVLPDGAPAADCTDLQIFCGDLPHALQSLPASPLPWRETTSELHDYPIRVAAYYPPPAPSLHIPALPDAVARLREQLRQIGAPPYIGITWRAGTAAREQTGANWVLSKEVPLSALGASLRASRGTLLALQRHPAAGEIDTLTAACGRPVADLTALNEQLEDMLALLALIEDYVGVSNTNMHLRAAVAGRARVLVPNPPEWRWMNRGRRSPWFPDFLLYRQSMHGDWDAALAALARDLATAS